MPAFGELYAIYRNKDVLNTTLAKIGGTKFRESYWSSSEYSSNYAWGLRFDNGNMDEGNKSSIRYVRPVINYGDWANSSAGDDINFDCSSCEIGDIMYQSRCYNENEFRDEIGDITIPEGYVVGKSQNKCFYFRDSPMILLLSIQKIGRKINCGPI